MHIARGHQYAVSNPFQDLRFTRGSPPFGHLLFRLAAGNLRPYPLVGMRLEGPETSYETASWTHRDRRGCASVAGPSSRVVADADGRIAADLERASRWRGRPGRVGRLREGRQSLPGDVAAGRRD